MNHFEPTLNLSTTNLPERRKALESELSKVIVAQVTDSLTSSLEKGLANSPVKLSRLAWDFHPESDDEGGTDWWVGYVTAYDEEGNNVDLEGFTVEVLSWDGKRTYESSLYEEVQEIVSGFKDDLYDQDITEILL